MLLSLLMDLLRRITSFMLIISSGPSSLGLGIEDPSPYSFTSITSRLHDSFNTPPSVRGGSGPVNGVLDDIT
ncbi:MAG: hypothetical protein ACP5UD_07985 [Conexivisphaera sp.]